MKIGIIGKGHVGTALATGLRHKGHEIRFASLDPNEPVDKAAAYGDVVILAVPYPAIPDVLSKACAELVNKTLIDVTNVLNPEGGLAIGCTTSGAEEIQRQLPQTNVVKAFNTVFAHNQNTGHTDHHQLTAFIAGDDPRSRDLVAALATDIGFQPVDCGDLTAARYLEPMAILLINLAFDQSLGTDIGYILEGIPREKRAEYSGRAEQFLTV
jgi:8-hydroxy-5-deazaflavin:NADPH oxidoreductase